MSWKEKLAFIGAGAMAEAIVAGLIANGVAGEKIVVSDPDPARRQHMQEQYGVEATADNRRAVTGAEIVVLAVKPLVLPAVLEELALSSPDVLFVSVVAGKDTAFIESRLQGQVRVIRAMPNTPALVGAGATALARGKYATSADMEKAGRIFNCVGLTVEVPESLMDAVTGLSGSGPAYVFLLLEALADGGVMMGLPRDLALKLAAQTMMGAARMVLETGIAPALLKEKVTTPGGTTIHGLYRLEAGGVRAAIMEAVRAATERARNL